MQIYGLTCLYLKDVASSTIKNIHASCHTGGYMKKVIGVAVAASLFAGMAFAEVSVSLNARLRSNMYHVEEYKDVNDSTVKFDAKLLCVKDYDRREKSGIIKDITDPILIGNISYGVQYPWQYRSNNEDKFRNVKFNTPQCGTLENPAILVNPIMAGTWIPSVIPAEEIWNNVTDYLLAIKEKPIIDNRTDIEHIESAGFDKKTSFRNM